MKYTLPLVLALGLLIGCDEPKPAATDDAAPIEGSAAKISSGKDAPEAGKKADKKADVKADEVKKTGDDGHKEELTEKDIADAKAAGILGLGSTPEDITPGASNVYGARFTVINEPVTLASAVSEPTEDVIKVSANVKSVCQAKGCWMILDGEGVELPIRVKMKGYKFFVPKNSDGAAAVLEGTLQKTVIKKAEAQHYADDAAKGTGKPAEKVAGDVDSYIFMANAIQLTKPKS